jgi:hypothetical protein
VQDILANYLGRLPDTVQDHLLKLDPDRFTDKAAAVKSSLESGYLTAGALQRLLQRGELDTGPSLYTRVLRHMRRLSDSAQVALLGLGAEQFPQKEEALVDLLRSADLSAREWALVLPLEFTGKPGALHARLTYMLYGQDGSPVPGFGRTDTYGSGIVSDYNDRYFYAIRRDKWSTLYTGLSTYYLARPGNFDTSLQSILLTLYTVGSSRFDLLTRIMYSSVPR